MRQRNILVTKTKIRVSTDIFFIPVNDHYRDLVSYTPFAGTNSVGLTELANFRVRIAL